MELLWAINADADEPVVLPKEGAPLIGQQGAVGLQAVVDETSTSVLALEGKYALVKTQRTHQRLATMPREQDLRLRLGFDILSDEGLQGLFAHAKTFLSFGGVDIAFLQIVAIVTSEVAEAADGLGHDVERGGKGG